MVTNTEYVERFSYRKYSGTTESRWKRVWSLSKFEMISTWHKSTWGKVLLIIILIINIMLAIFSTTITSALTMGVSSNVEKQEIIDNELTRLVSEYFTLGTRISPSSGYSMEFDLGIGFLIIALIAVAGSGFFADDRQGQVLEVYLARITREEYAFGKIFGMFLYSNIFTTLPLVFAVILFAQGFGVNHFDYIEFYARVTIYGMLVALLLGLGILILSTLVEKRMYASLGFFLFYILTSIFTNDPIFFESNEFLLLMSPSTFLSLLGFIMIGDYELFIVNFDTGSQIPLLLNNNTGLEIYHVIGITLGLIAFFLVILLWKIHRITTEDI
ncbi:MAG: hypothetical protein ACXAC7_09495 [Candidatus Hodarchaeales archaeon]|jgi:hypothetical protein